MLNEEETLSCIRRAKAGDGAAKEALLTHNTSLVKSIVRRYLGKGVEYDDLFQLACMGLLKAIAGFDERFGVRFSTYAVPMIAGEIKRFLRDDWSVKVSRVLKKTARDINRYIESRVAERGEAHPGRAQVITTLSGSVPEAYDVDIVKSVTQHEKAEKGLVIKVRDRELLQKAGGIVQGMSGSPIVQDGLLVGAVTHVFVSDPTRGYGVHARFMLEEAENAADMFAAGGREAA